MESNFDTRFLKEFGIDFSNQETKQEEPSITLTKENYIALFRVAFAAQNFINYNNGTIENLKSERLDNYFFKKLKEKVTDAKKYI